MVSQAGTGRVDERASVRPTGPVAISRRESSGWMQRLTGVPGLRSRAQRSHRLPAWPFAPLPQKRRRPAAREPLSSEARPAGLSGQHCPVDDLVKNVGRTRSVPVEDRSDACGFRDPTVQRARLMLA